MGRNFSKMSDSEFRWYTANHIGIPAILGAFIGIELDILFGVSLEFSTRLPALGLLVGGLLGLREIKNH